MKKIILSPLFLIIFGLNVIAQIPSNIPTKGLLAWYNFTGNVLDSSGHGNHLTNTNANLTTDRFGRNNRAYSFDGTSSYLSLSSPSFTFSDTSKFTYSIWMKKKNTVGVSIMIGSSAANNFITLLGGGTDTRFGTNKQQQAWVWASTTHNLNQWDHYVCVYNAGAMTLYKNGTSVATASFSYTGVTQANLPLFIGRDIGSSYFEGDLDDIGFWGRALSSTEIGNVYAGCENLVSIEPIDQKVAVGQTANFYCTVPNNSTYQWQIDTGTGYFNLPGSGQYSGGKTAYMSVSNVLLNNNNHKFRCIINLGICKDTTVVVKLQVTCGNLVKAEPADQTNFVSQSVVFNTSTYVDKLATFRWQENSGSGFNNLTDNGTYSGTKTLSLTISNLKAGMNNYLYRCLIQYQTCLDTSITRKLTVKTCPKMVAAQPQNVSIYEKFDALLTMRSADSTAGLQWQLNSGSGFVNISNGGQYSGVNNDSLLIKSLIKQNNNYQFRCLLTKTPCADTSNVATLKVLTCASLIQAQPSGQTVFINDNAYFGIKAIDSAGSSYQWQIYSSGTYFDLLNVGQFSGTTTPVLKVSNTSLTNDNYTFRCVLSRFPCMDTSKPVILHVQACGALISQQAGNASAYPDSAVILKIEGTQGSAAYQWQLKSGTKFINLNNGVQYAGVFTKQLTIKSLTQVNNNQEYRCFVTYYSCKDSSQLSKISVLKCLTLIASQPTSQSKKINESSTFTVVGSNAKVSYQWQAKTSGLFNNIGDTGQYSGTKTETLVVKNLTLKNNKTSYRCIFSLPPCSDTSATVLLSVSDPSGVGDFYSNEQVSIYPNPASEYMEVRVSELLIGLPFTLTNSMGQPLISGTITTLNMQIKLEGISSGVYHLKLGNLIGRTVSIQR